MRGRILHQTCSCPFAAVSTVKLPSHSSNSTHLREVFTGSSIDCRIGRVKEGASLPRLTGALFEKLAWNMLGVCAAQTSQSRISIMKGKEVLLFAVLGGLLARSKCCEPLIRPFFRDRPLGRGVGFCVTPTAVSPFAPNEFRSRYSPDCRCDGRATPGRREDGFRCIAVRCAA